MMFSPTPDERICEVSPRDGLPSVQTVMPTVGKRRWIDGWTTAGRPAGGLQDT